MSFRSVQPDIDIKSIHKAIQHLCHYHIDEDLLVILDADRTVIGQGKITVSRTDKDATVVFWFKRENIQEPLAQLCYNWGNPKHVNTDKDITNHINEILDEAS